MCCFTTSSILYLLLTAPNLSACTDDLPCFLQTAVIGTAEGLYSFLVDDDGKLKSRSRIEGLTNVHQIVLVKSAGVTLFIAGTLSCVLICPKVIHSIVTLELLEVMMDSKLTLENHITVTES